MSCEDARELFSALADQALTPGERAGVQTHLAACAECAREWQRFEATLGLLRSVEPARAPAGFVDRVLAARPRPWYRRLGRALLVPWPAKLPLQAAALVLIAGLAILIFHRSPDLRRAARAPEPSTPPPATSDTHAAPPAPEALAERTAAPPPRSAPATTPAPSGTVERDAEHAERPSSAELPAERKAGQPERLTSRQEARASAPDVRAALQGRDRTLAGREVLALAARLGGTATLTGPDLVEVSVPRASWDELVHALGRLGTLRIETRPDALPPTVRLALRLEG